MCCTLLLKTAKIKSGLGYQVRIDCHNYKMFYVSPMETTKKRPTVDTSENEKNKIVQPQKSTNHKERQLESKRGAKML